MYYIRPIFDGKGIGELFHYWGFLNDMYYVLIREDFQKIYQSIFFRSVLIIMTFVIILAAWISSSYLELSDHWKTELQEENEKLRNKLKDQTKQSEFHKEEKEKIEKHIRFNEYLMEENIRHPSPKNFITESFSSYFFILICTAILAVHLFYEKRNDLPNHYSDSLNIFFSKCFVLLLYIILFFLYELLSSIVFGGLILGFDGMFDPLVRYEDLVQVSIIPYLIKVKLLQILATCVLTGVSLIIAMRMKNKRWATVIAVICTIGNWFFSLLITYLSITAPTLIPDWTKWMYFSYTFAAEQVNDLHNIDGLPILFSSFILMVWLLFLLWFNFNYWSEEKEDDWQET